MTTLSKIQEESKRLIKEMKLPDSFSSSIDDIYIPLAEIVMNKKEAEPLFISINGAQGTGKSTLTQFLKHLIEIKSGLTVADISLDDFYLTRKERVQLANNNHPLFLTRGVPGTHDANLMENTISALLDQRPCIMPRFDKAIDDRCNESMWTQYNSDSNKLIDIILFEGWCNNSPEQSTEELATPINELEENEDSDGIWRNYANEQLSNYNNKIFQQADMSIMLKAPDFNSIYEWRTLQENKLMDATTSRNNLKIMSPAELQRFIQHYERISRHTLDHLPSTADIVIPISKNHDIKEIIIKQSS